MKTIPPSVIPAWAIAAAESLVEPVVCANSGGENEYTRLPTISEIAAGLVVLRKQWEKPYFDLADVVCRESTGVEDACRQARELRARLEHAEHWKAEHLTVESWWAKIDEYVRKQPDARIGESVAHLALEMLVKSREDSARLDWLKAQPYERLQKVREWLPISYVPPAPDAVRAAIDNAMKHDPNFRP